MRFGAHPSELISALREKENIWVHAVSVGEVLAVAPLIKNMKMLFPSEKIVLTTVTRTGYGLAKKSLVHECIVLYAPIDFSWVVNKFIDRIKPKIYVCMETELWPNIFHSLFKYKVPIILINGRISDRGFRGYRKIRFLTKKVLSYVTLLCMQTQADEERIIALGASREKVRVVGNLKFDIITSLEHQPREILDLDPDAIIFIAGSTHPGEEEILLNVYASLKQKFNSLRLIIAPRHVERAVEIEKLVREKGFNPIFYTQLFKNKNSPDSVIIVDTIGQLRFLYSLANVVFIGKTLCVGGGQNIIEPAVFAKPIIVGPRTENFREIVDDFKKEKAIIQVQNEEELLKVMEELFKDPQKLKEIGLKAKNLIETHQGATLRTLSVIQRYVVKR